MERSIQSENDHKLLKAHLLAFVTIFIWSTTYISTKILLETFSQTEIMFFRFILAYFALLLAKPALRIPGPLRIPYRSPGEELLFACAGLCGVTMYFTLQNISLVYTLASNAGVLVSVAPFFTAIFSYIFLKGEPMHKSFFIGFCFSIIGITLISFNGNLILKLNPLGDILAVSCAVVWAIYCIFMKKISAFGYHVILCTRKIFLYGIIFMLPILPFSGFHWDPERFTYLPNVFHMLFLGLGASALCFVTWNYAVGILGPVRTSVYIYIGPIITVVTSAIFLRERITFMAILGAVLVLAGLCLSEQKTFLQKEKKDEDHRNETGDPDPEK
jgi:drug/metabolite transporter (DMT)-like permease